MIYREIDKNGYYIQDVEFAENIDTSKYILENYGSMRKPKWTGTEWIDENPIDEFVELKNNKIIEIKQTAGNIIISRYPDWKQRNMIARSLELKTKTSITTDEQLELDKYQSIWDFIEDIRNQSNNFENEVNALTTIDEVKNYSYEFIL